MYPFAYNMFILSILYPCLLPLDLEMISISKAGICGATRLLSEEHRNTYYPWNVYSSLLSVLWQHWQASPLPYITWIAHKSNKKRPHCMNFVRLPVHTTWAAFECKNRTKKRKKESERTNERVYVCVRACKYCRITSINRDSIDTSVHFKCNEGKTM